MKIVVPMAGTGDRYIRAGYHAPKPLIDVDGRPMVRHVIDLFPGEDDFLFICNQQHLETTPIRETLLAAKPNARIIGIASHKLGPVHTVFEAIDAIDKDDEVIVNYCDFGACWNYADFLATVRGHGADGAMSAYRGFHPHSLGPTLYAYMRVDGNWMEEIKEKGHFTANRMEEFASSGTYYFRRGEYVHRYFRELMDRQLTIGGEYYISLVYNLMKDAGLKTYVYELEHFLQWGTPLDLREYQRWSDYFAAELGTRAPRSRALADRNLVLMAGRGQRFVDAGYTAPKPFIAIDAARDEMVVRAARDLPPASQWSFVVLDEHAASYPVNSVLSQAAPNFDTIRCAGITEGQACTALLARNEIEADASVLIAACDYGMVWNADAYAALVDDPSVDVIVWTFRGDPAVERNPKAFGWVVVEGIDVTRVSVKVPISDQPVKDHAVTGTFFFRRAGDYFAAADEMIRANARINGEFYIDEAINWAIAAGLRVVVFEVNAYAGWGTPDQLKTYQYWASHFGEPSRLARASA